MSDKKSKATVEQWRELANKQLRGKSLDNLTISTPEGIDIKPLYTQADVADLEFAKPYNSNRPP